MPADPFPVWLDNWRSWPEKSRRLLKTDDSDESPGFLFWPNRIGATCSVPGCSERTCVRMGTSFRDDTKARPVCSLAHAHMIASGEAG